jgi:hypothetical protein
MRTRQLVGFILAGAFLSVSVAWAQDSQPLGDAARQVRVRKQQKEAKAKDAPAKSNDGQPTKSTRKVVTNEDIPEHVGSTLTSARNSRTPPYTYVPPSYGTPQAPAEQWKAMFQAQKSAMTSLQQAIDNLTDSIEHPKTCITDCEQQNLSQRMKAQQLDSMKAQLEAQQKRLEDLQELARKQGFGSAVYDP